MHISVKRVRLLLNSTYLVQQVTKVVLNARTLTLFDHIYVGGEQVLVTGNLWLIVVRPCASVIEELSIIVLQYVPILRENFAFVQKVEVLETHFRRLNILISARSTNQKLVKDLFGLDKFLWVVRLSVCRKKLLAKLYTGGKLLLSIRYPFLLSLLPLQNLFAFSFFI